MTDRELKKLSRADLLELLLEQRRINARLYMELQETKEKLASRIERGGGSRLGFRLRTCLCFGRLLDMVDVFLITVLFPEPRHPARGEQSQAQNHQHRERV